MKRVNYIAEINGRHFKARHDEVIQCHNIDECTPWGYPVRLSEVYGKCSCYKESAWNDWCDWVGRYFENGASMHIGSHTAQFFTLIMVVKDKATGTWWRCIATGRNEYATRIEIVE